MSPQPDAVLAAAWNVGKWCDEYETLPRERQQRIYDLNAAMHALPVGRNVVVTEARLAALEAVAEAARRWMEAYDEKHETDGAEEGEFWYALGALDAAGLPEGEQPRA